ncbi:MAG: hypothetical protein RQ936_09690, partial [Gammaproteobacteria bacterium]|nr:hypothetical protein [Gammaproteobacteria bacterium]
MGSRSFISFCTFIALYAPGLSNAVAADFSYHYVQISHVSATDDSLGMAIDFSAIGAHGSYEINRDMAITAGYFSGSYRPLPIDSRDLEAGITLHTPISHLADVTFNASLLQSELQTPFGDADDNGYRLKAGIRYYISHKVELTNKTHGKDTLQSRPSAAGMLLPSV